MRRLCSVIWLLFALAALVMPINSNAQVICISNVSPPPELPAYEQPPIPAAGYMWSPGYWASGPNGYFWVPGTWVEPPAIGLLWTPGYWGWRDGIYVWNAGYWGPHIGFYGGVNYGFGYGGVGFEGGRWENGVFAYNRTVNNFGGVTITNVYEKTIVIEPGATRASFNGGSGGVTARPTPQEEAAAHEQHVAAIPAQLQHERTASSNKALLASENHGHPAIAATAKPSEFSGKGVVAAREVKPRSTLPETKLRGTKPAEAVGTTPTGPSPQAVKPSPTPDLAKLPTTKPDAGATPGSNHSGSGASERKGPPDNQAKLNGGSPPTPSNTAAKPLGATPPPQAVKPNPPPPRPATASAKPPPPAKPAACPPGKKMTPDGCK